MTAKQSEVVGNITIADRKSITLDGVIDVLSFDEGGVTLSTSLGLLTVEGEALHVKKMDMDAGVVALEGTVNGVFYVDHTGQPRKGLFGRRK